MTAALPAVRADRPPCMQVECNICGVRGLPHIAHAQRWTIGPRRCGQGAGKSATLCRTQPVAGTLQTLLPASPAIHSTLVGDSGGRHNG